MTELSCKAVRSGLWDYARELSAHGSVDSEVSAHLDVCRDCGRALADVSSVRAGVRNLPVRMPPPLVMTKLQVVASRERSRRMLRLDPAAWLRDKWATARMSFNHLLRPFAVPAAGGLLASCLCFSMIAQTLQLRPYMVDNDMPIGLFTEMTINDVSPFSFSTKDVTVQVSVDANGNVTDFEMPQGSNPTPDELNGIGSLVLYSTFTPATRFGQRVSSKRLFSIHHIDVRD